MNATHFLYESVTRNIVSPGDKTCILCGCLCSESVDVNRVIKDTFTNHGMCRCPSSRDVCPACEFYFNHRWPEENQKYPCEFRKRSLLVTEQGWTDWQRPDMRADIERWLTDGCPRGVFVVALSKKKHCLPLAMVNEPARCFTIQLEESQVELSPDGYNLMMEAFDAMIQLGCAKGEILSGCYHDITLRKAGIAGILQHDAVIAPMRPSGLLQLVSYIHLGPGESDDESANDDEP